MTKIDFEQWWEKNDTGLLEPLGPFIGHTIKEFAEMAWDSRQAEIDKLKKELQAANEVINSTIEWQKKTKHILDDIIRWQNIIDINMRK